MMTPENLQINPHWGDNGRILSPPIYGTGDYKVVSKIFCTGATIYTTVVEA
jgi:hypothetical protein